MFLNPLLLILHFYVEFICDMAFLFICIFHTLYEICASLNEKKMENKNEEEVWSLNVARGFNTPFFPNENDNLIIYPYELAAL